MTAPRETLAEGIDRQWLEAEAAVDPVSHAWALWDLDHERGRFRFVSFLRDGLTRAYLLVWYGGPTPIVIWVSKDPADGLLCLGLPLPPVHAAVPERVAPAVRQRLRASSWRVVDVLVCSSRPLGPPDPRVRALTSDDASAVSQLAARNPEAQWLGGLSDFLGRLPVWGAFEADRLVAVARVAIQLPAVWHISDVFTDPDFRGRGLAREVTAAVTNQALAAGARASLTVRADNAPAQTIYRELGYQQFDRRIWIESGDTTPPSPPSVLT